MSFEWNSTSSRRTSRSFSVAWNFTGFSSGGAETPRREREVGKVEKSQAKQTSAWRILLFARNGAELLLLRSPSGIRLPELHIPEWQRIVPNLNAEAKRLWSLDTVCLFPFDVPHSEGTAGNSKYYVMEVLKPGGRGGVA